jgi:hypothetical protein
VISAQVALASNPQDRKRFSDLLDYLAPDPFAPWKLPSARNDGKAENPNIRAFMYAKLRHILAALWRLAPSREVEPLVAFVEKVANLNGVGYHYVGDAGLGWELELNTPEKT